MKATGLACALASHYSPFRGLPLSHSLRSCFVGPWRTRSLGRLSTSAHDGDDLEGAAPSIWSMAFDDQSLTAIQSRIASFGGPVPLLKLPSGRQVFDPKQRSAAVLVPLCNRGGNASVLFQLRSMKVGTHVGQVSFPGGKTEHGETPVETALREAVEEMGPLLKDVRVLGTCQSLPAVNGMPVTPVLAFLECGDLGDLSGIRQSLDEVAEVFTLSLAQLNDPQKRMTQDLGPRGKDAPVFLGGPQRVWGLTAFILDGVLRNVLAPALSAQTAPP